jgi:hypothetical protein
MATNKEYVHAFSNEFCNAIARVIEAKAKNGDCVKRATVAREIRKEVGIKNMTLLTVMVGLAVQEKSVPGVAATRGKNGGLYSIAQLEAWNAAVDAEEVVAPSSSVEMPAVVAA